MAQQSSTDRVNESIHAAFAKQDFYEAHQIFKSLTFRYQRLKKFEELSEILYNASMEFFRLNVPQSGIDLARQFVDTLEKGNLPVTDDRIQKIATLLREIPAKPESERAVFWSTVIAWSVKRNPEIKTGHLALHAAVAKIFLSESNYSSAAYHFVRALDPVSCVKAIHEFSEQSEVDSNQSGDKPVRNADGSDDLDQKLAGLAVLEFLALQRPDLAKEVFVNYVSQHRNPEVRSKCYNFRILAIVSALMSVCSKSNEHGTVEEFKRLETALAEIYSDNPRVGKLLAIIGQHYLGIKAPGPFQGLFSLFRNPGQGSSPSSENAPSASATTSSLMDDLAFD